MQGPANNWMKYEREVGLMAWIALCWSGSNYEVSVCQCCRCRYDQWNKPWEPRTATSTDITSHWWRRGVAVECRTCDQEVASSSLSRAQRRKNSGQVSHTYVPLLPSSITWYQSNGSCLATGEQTNCGPCVGGRLKTCYTRAESDSLLSCEVA